MRHRGCICAPSLFELQNDRSESADVLGVPGRLGVEVAQLGHSVPLGAGFDLQGRRFYLAFGRFGGGAVRRLQFGELKKKLCSSTNASLRYIDV